MKQFLMLACLSIMISTVAIAEETAETCANGAGTVITGAVTGHKYCQSNTSMDWWNAIAWCDALGRKLFSMDDCTYNSTSTSCPELTEVGDSIYVWTTTPKSSTTNYNVRLSTGSIHYGNNALRKNSTFFALCK